MSDPVDVDTALLKEPDEMCAQLEGLVEKIDVDAMQYIMEKVTAVLLSNFQSGTSVKRSPVYCLLRVKPSTSPGAKVKGGKFFARLQELSREKEDMFEVEVNRFTYSSQLWRMRRTSPLLKHLLRPTDSSSQEEERSYEEHIKYDYMQFYLYCLCMSLNSQQPRTDEVIDKIRSYQKLIDDYLLYFFERTNSTKKNRVMTSMTSLSAWGSSPKKKKETPKEKMKKAHGLTFIALITELWINTYVPFESPHECHVTWIDLEKKGTLGVIAAPSDKLLLCLLDVVTYVCGEPWQNPNAKPQDLKIKEHIKMMQAPLYRFILRCFKNGSSFGGEIATELLMDIWCSFLSMSTVKVCDKMYDSAHNERVKKPTGGMGFGSKKPKVLGKMEKWAEENFAFFYVLPLHYVLMCEKSGNATGARSTKLVKKLLEVYTPYGELGNGKNKLVEYIKLHVYGKDGKEEGTRPEIKDKGSPLYKFRAHIKMLDEHVKDKPDKFADRSSQIMGFDEPGGFRERYVREDLNEESKIRWNKSFQKLKDMMRGEEKTINALKDVLGIEVKKQEQNKAEFADDMYRRDRLLWAPLYQSVPWHQPVSAELMASGIIIDCEDDTCRDVGVIALLSRYLSRQLYQRVWAVLAIVSLVIPLSHAVLSHFHGSNAAAAFLFLGFFAIWRWISAEEDYESSSATRAPPRFWLDFSFMMQSFGGTRSPFLCLFWVIIGSWIVDKCAEFLQEEILNHYINSPLWVYALGYPVAVLACIGWQAGTFGAKTSSKKKKRS